MILPQLFPKASSMKVLIIPRSTLFSCLLSAVVKSQPNPNVYVMETDVKPSKFNHVHETGTLKAKLETAIKGKPGSVLYVLETESLEDDTEAKRATNQMTNTAPIGGEVKGGRSLGDSKSEIKQATSESELQTAVRRAQSESLLNTADLGFEMETDKLPYPKITPKPQSVVYVVETVEYVGDSGTATNEEKVAIQTKNNATKPFIETIHNESDRQSQKNTSEAKTSIDSSNIRVKDELETATNETKPTIDTSVGKANSELNEATSGGKPNASIVEVKSELETATNETMPTLDTSIGKANSELDEATNKTEANATKSIEDVKSKLLNKNNKTKTEEKSSNDEPVEYDDSNEPEELNEGTKQVITDYSGNHHVPAEKSKETEKEDKESEELEPMDSNYEAGDYEEIAF